MFRYKFILEYHGGKFESGWQRQPGRISVQETLEKAATQLTKQEVVFHGAGRTDRGVHALGQVAHCDLRKSYPLKRLREGMNHYLRDSGCRIRLVEPAKRDFHARFCAKMKEYVYLVSLEERIFEQGLSWRIMPPIDLALISEQAVKLLGQHDFTSFRDHLCQAQHPIRTIEDIKISQEEHRIIFQFRGKSFLHKQIRIMVGTLIDIAKGRLDDISQILEMRDRSMAGQTAPGCGLFLKSVESSDVVFSDIPSSFLLF